LSPCLFAYPAFSCELFAKIQPTPMSLVTNYFFVPDTFAALEPAFIPGFHLAWQSRQKLSK
jgi:hypothetical protein